MDIEKEMSNYINPIYEDNHIIVAVKPPNIPTQGDITG
ncbi:pseudouridine synthase, partial [Brachyspira hyodysenteriae]